MRNCIVDFRISKDVFVYTIKFFYLFIYFIKTFMLCIIMQLDILTRLTSQVITIICHHIKKILLKKYKKLWKIRPKLIY